MNRVFATLIMAIFFAAFALTLLVGAASDGAITVLEGSMVTFLSVVSLAFAYLAGKAS